jgi:hypothetical protein
MLRGRGVPVSSFPLRREPLFLFFPETKIPMALHRDIYWVGRQWAVTGSGIQACNQKQRGKFDIEAARLWEDGVQESVRALKWVNLDDFEEAISVARKYYPEPPRKHPPAPPMEASGSRLEGRGPKDSVPVEPAKEPPKQVRAFDMRIGGLHAKFVPVWRIRVRGR